MEKWNNRVDHCPPRQHSFEECPNTIIGVNNLPDIGGNNNNNNNNNNRDGKPKKVL